MTTVQQLTSQLREREGRLRQREEELQQKDTQIQLKDQEIQLKNADNSRLQREMQRLQVGIKVIARYNFSNCVRFPRYQTTLYAMVYILLFNLRQFECVMALQESLLRVTQHSGAEQRPTVKVTATLKLIL